MFASVTGIAGAIGVAAALTLLGSRLGGALADPADSRGYRLGLYSVSGWVALHLLLTALSLGGIPWRLPVLAAGIAALWLAAWRFLPAPAKPERHPTRFGWGDGLALAALLIFIAFALSRWIATSDFVFHWGLKGFRFYLAQGVDYAYLARSWNWVMHPDYPNLVPELFATTALAAGHFDEPAMMLWSAICFALLLAALREALLRAGASRFVAQAALATIALLLAAYGIVGRTAGGADWLIALALAAALPPLLGPADRRGAARIGVIAAFAAASKIEGVALAGALVGIYAVRLWRHPPAARVQDATAPPGERTGPWRRIDWRLAAVLLLPTAAVVVPWLLAVQHYHLFLKINAGPLVPARLPRVLAAVGAMLHIGQWHGFAYGLALLPLLAIDRRLRALVAAVTLQLLFYLYVFLSVPFDPMPLIETSFPRLVLHLLPAVLAAAAIALERPARPAPPPQGQAAAGGAAQAG